MASKGGGGKGPQRWKKAPQQQQRADGGSKHAAQGASTRPAGPQTREGVVAPPENEPFMLHPGASAATMNRWRRNIALLAAKEATESKWHTALRCEMPTGKPEAERPEAPDPSNYPPNQRYAYLDANKEHQLRLDYFLKMERMIENHGAMLVADMLFHMSEEAKMRVTLKYGPTSLLGRDPVELMERIERVISVESVGTNVQTNVLRVRISWSKMKQRRGDRNPLFLYSRPHQVGRSGHRVHENW